MIFLKWFKDILLYPIEWFWNKYQKENSIWKIILLFVLSLGSFVVLFFLTLWCIEWIFLNHIEIVIGLFVIGWLYSYVRSRMKEKENLNFQQYATQQALLQTQQSEEKRLQEEQALHSYPIIRNILYQTLKTSADNIGGLVPRVLEEIEVDGKHFIITNKIVFYQFRLSKANISNRYNTDELQEFAKILQNDIANKIRSGAFPSLAIQSYVDEFGNTYEAIYIEIIEDIDNYFLIQAVFCSPFYVTYLRTKKINQTNNNNSLQDEQW